MNNRIKLYLKIIILAGIISRFLFMTVYSDLKSDNYWEYGHIAKNILDGKGYSYYYEKNGKIDYVFNIDSKPLPSAYMPPGYVFTLIPFILMENTFVRNLSLFGFQILISVLIIFLLFKLVRKLFDEKIALLAATIYAITPEFLYSSLTFGTTVFYHLGIVLFFYVIISCYSNKRKSILIGLISAFIIYYRPEFLLFIVLFVFWMLFQQRIKYYFISLFIIIILILPWAVRNYIVFDNFLLLTTTSGQNFYRGHNDYRPGVWADEELAKRIDKLEPTTDYELERNEIFFTKAFESIKRNPIKEITNDLEKIIHLWLFDYYDKRIINVMYILPWMLILFFGIYGFIKSPESQTKQILSLFFIYHTLLAVIFFAIPRYQTNMKIAIIIFSAYGIKLLIKKLNISKLKSSENYQKNETR